MLDRTLSRALIIAATVLVLWYGLGFVQRVLYTYYDPLHETEAVPEDENRRGDD